MDQDLKKYIEKHHTLTDRNLEIFSRLAFAKAYGMEVGSEIAAEHKMSRERVRQIYREVDASLTDLGYKRKEVIEVPILDAKAPVFRITKAERAGLDDLCKKHPELGIKVRISFLLREAVNLLLDKYQNQ